MFKKRHYEEIAKLINETDGNMKLDIFISSKLIPLFKKDSEVFNKEKFLKACYK